MEYSRVGFGSMNFSTAEFKQLIKQAVAEIPPELAGYLSNVSIDVEPMPDERTCRSLDLRDPAELMGLYQGTPLTERSVEQSAHLPDRIIIYQRNIERIARTQREIVEQVRMTVLHEIGHHFGLDEDQLDGLGYA